MFVILNFNVKKTIRHDMAPLIDNDLLTSDSLNLIIVLNTYMHMHYFTEFVHLLSIHVQYIINNILLVVLHCDNCYIHIVFYVQYFIIVKYVCHHRKNSDNDVHILYMYIYIHTHICNL